MTPQFSGLREGNPVDIAKDLETPVIGFYGGKALLNNNLYKS
jgi:hypothetical protein